MGIKVGKTEIPEPSGPGWYDRILEIILLLATGYFVWWVVNIFIDTGREPVATISLVAAIVAGTEGILYLNRRKKDDIVRETIRYERDYSSFPMAAEDDRDDSIL